jgi:hypothetical protein
MRKITVLIFIVGFTFHSYGQNLLNQQFEASKGKWEVPLKKYTSVFDNEILKRCPAYSFDSTLRILTDTAYEVKALYSGNVILVFETDSLKYCVVVKYGNYSLAYFPITKLSVKLNDAIKEGEPIGILATDLDDNYNLEIILSYKEKDLCAKKWINWKSKTKTIEACATTSEYVYQKSN